MMVCLIPSAAFRKFTIFSALAALCALLSQVIFVELFQCNTVIRLKILYELFTEEITFSANRFASLAHPSANSMASIPSLVFSSETISKQSCEGRNINHIARQGFSVS